MSNISRRDFMKTAGVMTLAVAASGVLAGCSTADDTTKPTTSTGMKAGETATVANAAFTVTGVKVLQSVTKSMNDDKTAIKETYSDRYIYILASLNSTKEDKTPDFDTTKMSVYVNGKLTALESTEPKHTDKDGSETKVAVNKEKDLGDKNITFGGSAKISSIAYNKKAKTYFFAVAAPQSAYADEKADNVYADITSIKVVYYDAGTAGKDATSFTYDLDVPTAAQYND